MQSYSKPSENTNKVVITAYFSGTSHEIKDTHTLAGFLNSSTSINQIHMGYDGCGITNGFTGGIFGSGLADQAEEVANKVNEQLALGKKIILNAYGHSRGGIAALLLAKKLGDIDPDCLEVNLALVDPVPGNLLTTSEVDFLNISLANQTKDVSSCSSLKSVLCLYPYEPLPTYVVHAPIIPRYPVDCDVEEDVINGCHSGAQYLSCQNDNKYYFNYTQFVTYARIKTYLEKHGTKFTDDHHTIYLNDSANGSAIEKNDYIETVKLLYTYQNKQLAVASERSCHSDEWKQINATTRRDYFNLHHKQLCHPNQKVTDQNDCALQIRPMTGLRASIGRNIQLRSTLKWLAIGVLVSTVVFFTGGFAAIPLFAGLGSSAIAAAMPVIAVGLASFWHLIIKPLAGLCCGKNKTISHQNKENSFRNNPSNVTQESKETTPLIPPSTSQANIIKSLETPVPQEKKEEKVIVLDTTSSNVKKEIQNIFDCLLSTESAEDAKHSNIDDGHYEAHIEALLGYGRSHLKEYEEVCYSKGNLHSLSLATQLYISGREMASFTAPSSGWTLYGRTAKDASILDNNWRGNSEFTCQDGIKAITTSIRSCI